MPLTEHPVNAVTEQIIGAAIRVHREIGPGVLESIYARCLAFDLLDEGLVVDCQVPFPVRYRGRVLHSAFRADLIVNKTVIVEIKSVDRLMRVHEAQLLGYLKFAKFPVGLLFNFNVKWLMNDGFRRVVNELLPVP